MHFTAGLAAAAAARHPLLVVGWTRRFPRALYPGTETDTRSTTVVSADALPILDLLDPRTWRRAARRIRDFDADLLVLQWWHPIHAPVVRALAHRARRAGIATAVICHNVEPHESNRLWREITRRTLRCADALIAHSAATAAHARALIPGARVIDGFLPIFDNVAAATGPAQLPEIAALRARLGVGDRPLLLTFGYVRPYKGVEDAIAALAHCEHDAVLLVAGECWDDPDQYATLARDAGVAERVRFELRYVGNDELPAMFGAADAVVLPYRQATQSGVAALAFAYGRPVVATRVGGLPDLVEDGVTGALAAACDPKALAAAIDRVLGSTRAWGPEIARTCARLSWDRYVNLLLDARAAAPGRRDPVTHAMLEIGSREAKAAKLIRILTSARPLRGATILDVGTGSGTIARALADAAGPLGQVVSVDVADVRVESGGYEFLRYDGTDLPLGDASVDVAVSNHVIEHVGDARAQRHHLREIARVLRPGGLLYVAVPHRWQLIENHYRLPLLGWVPRPLANRYLRLSGRGRDFDVRALGRRQLLGLMRDAGLDARDATTDLVDASIELGSERSARLLRRMPAAARLLRGPVLPTIAALGRKPS